MSKEEWQVGWYIDYYDITAREWVVIKILKLNQSEEEIYYEFEGWPKNWNNTCKISSRKLAPFRLKSVGYTGPKENVSRDWTFKLEDLQNCEEKVKNLINGNLSCSTAGETTQFLRGELFTFIDNLLICNYRKNDVARVAQFFCLVIQYITEWLKKANEFFPIYYDWLANPEIMIKDNKAALSVAWPELLITLKRLFGLDLRTAKFHRNNTLSLKDYELWYGTSIRNNCQVQSYFVNIFGKSGGFEIVIALLSQKEEKQKIPFEFLKEIPIFEIGQLLDKRLVDTFALGLKDLVIQRIELISQKELKEINKDHVEDVLVKTKRFMNDCLKKPNLEELDRIELALILKFFKSPYMEKRLKALNEINELIEKISKYRSDSLISSRALVEWITREQIVKQIFNYSHAEMMKRVSDILKFLHKNEALSKELIDLFWESAVGKHDSIIIETHKAILELADYLKLDMMTHLYKKAKEISIINYDEKLVKFLKDFVIKIFNLMYNSRLKVEDQGIELFLPLLHDSCPVNFCDLAVEYIVELIRHPVLRSRTSRYMQLCMDNVLQGVSVPQHLKLLNQIIAQTAPGYVDEGIKLIEQSSKTIDPILQNFQKYMLRNPEDPASHSRYTHKQNIEIRLKIIGLIMTSPQFQFSFASHFSVLWSIFSNADVIDSDLFFAWLEEITREKLTKPLTSDIFQNIICVLPIEKITLKVYECFKTQFLYVNYNERFIDVRANGFYSRNSEKIIGIEFLFKIAVFSQAGEVVSNATTLIVAINLRLTKAALNNKSAIWNSFIDNLLDFSAANPEAVSSIINILQNFLEENYVIGTSVSSEAKIFYYKTKNEKSFSKISVNYSDTVRSIRKKLENVYRKPWNSIILRFANSPYDSSNDSIQVTALPNTSSFLVEFQSPKSDDYSPKDFLSQNERVQSLLLDSISDHQNPCAHEAWNLLTSLHINEEIKESITKLKHQVSQLIDGKSLYKMLYSLLIVKELIQDQSWVSRFEDIKGFEYIVKLFQEHNVFSFNDSTCMKYSTVMIILIEECLKFSLSFEYKFVQQLFDCLIMIGKFAQDPDDEKLVAVGKSAKNIFSELCRNNKNLICLAIREYSNFDELIVNNFLNCCSFQYSNIVMNLFLEILGSCEELLPYITKKMFGLVDKAMTAKYCSSFWMLLSQLVSEAKDSEFLKKYLKSLRKNIELHPGESSSKEKKIELFGLMSVLKSAIDKKYYEPRSKFISLLLKKYLFETSIEENLPKCKCDETRKLAFDIIEKSYQIRTKSIKPIIKYLSEFHLDTHWRTKNIHDWNYSPALEEKSLTGFVGLKNIGNICYMNSTLQQLFNIPTFCEELLRSDSAQKPDSNLKSLQFIFSGLKTSAKQYMSPKKLCTSFKDWEGRPINILEQMDADEFFNNLMDKLENEMKGTQTEHSIRNHFGGIQITECIGQGDCKHKSERAEAFMTLPVQVKNKKSLLESLESFVEGEILEGDNAYECDHCQAKVSALRRVCIKHVPNILIIVLRRFEFDFDTMNRVKVNDYCEFPMEIDMEPYTQEGLERKEQSKELKEPVSKKFPDDYYLFKLKGITIHTGTAESGHYYSYIENRKTSLWYEFNDIFVSAFDPEDIPAEAYGGVEKWSNFYSTNYSGSIREKYRNAYLLFYEREHKYAYRNKDDENLEDLRFNSNTSQPMVFPEVLEENERYWRCKSIFSLEYYNFVSKLLRNAGGSEEIVKFCCAAFLVIFIRSKDLMKSCEFLSNLENAIKQTVQTRDWLCDLVCVQAVYKELIIDCPIEDKSRFIVEIIATAFEGLDKDSTKRVLNNFSVLFPLAAYSKNNGNYFKLLSVLVGKTKKYASKNIEIQGVVIKFMSNEEVKINTQIEIEIDNDYLGHNPSSGISVERISEEKCPTYIPVILEMLAEDLIEDQAKVLFTKSIMKYLIHVNNKIGTKSVSFLYYKLGLKFKEKSKDYYNYLITSYKENDFDKAKIYFRQLKVLIEVEENPDPILSELTEIMKDFKNYSKITEVSIDFLFKLCQKYLKVREWFLSKSRDLKWIENWISNSSFNPRASLNTYKKSNIAMSSVFIPVKSNYERTEIYKKIIKNQLSEYQDYDSDDEFPFDSISENNKIDIFDQSINKWVKAYVMVKLRGILGIKFENSNERGLKWFELDSELLAPDGTRVKSNRL